MSNKNSNFPTNDLNKLPDGFCTNTVGSLRELAINGKPKTIEELETRIDDYFKYCQQKDFRCGIESLCLALGVSRQTLWNWCNGIGCSEAWKEKCCIAKQFILTFLEQATWQGKINPASSIFYLKNWGNYKDSISFDDNTPEAANKNNLSLEDMRGKIAELTKNTSGTI